MLKFIIATLFSGALAFGAAKIQNADIKDNAAIAYSKLNLTGSVVNADIGSSAAINYSKLLLTDSIVNADINSSAAIAYSKLDLTDSLVNADISSSAAVNYSKLLLTDSIVNADINSSAAIALSKLATLNNNSTVITNGSGVLTNGDALTVGGVLFADSSGLPVNNSANMFWDSSSFRLGIGTHAAAAPAAPNTVDAKLHVFGASQEVLLGSRTASSPMGLRFYLTGTNGANTNANDYVGLLRYSARVNGSNNVNIAEIYGQYTGSGTTQHGEIVFLTANGGSPAEVLRINNDGTLDSSVYTQGVAQFDSSGIMSSTAPGAVGHVLASNGTAWVDSTVPVVPSQTISASNIDWSTGNVFKKTLSANTTFTFSGKSDGQTIFVKVRNPANYTVTFPNTLGGESVMWTGSVPPVATTGNKISSFTFVFDGTEILGSFLGNF